MFKWFIKPKLDTVAIVTQARERLLTYLEHGEHGELVDVFRKSIIDHESASQYLMIEIEIGSIMQKLKRMLKYMDIEVYQYKRHNFDKLNTIFIKEKYIVNEATTMFILIKILMIKLGYEAKSTSHIPHTLGRFISESSKV